MDMDAVGEALAKYVPGGTTEAISARKSMLDELVEVENKRRRV